MPGIHQRIPATRPSLRKVKVSLSLSMRPAASCVVVSQALPMIGKRASTIGPAARSRSTPAAGLRMKSSLVKSNLNVMMGIPAQAQLPYCNRTV
jgi:hypothetical protein